MTKEDEKEEYTFEPILKKFDYTLGGYSHRERWSCTRWRWKYQLRNRSKISTSSAVIEHLMRKSTIHSHREGFATSWRKQPKDFGYWNSQTKLPTNIMILKPRHRDKKLECRGRKDHEGKTSRSVLHGLVYAHECALLVNFRIHNMKKNPGGCTRYPKKYWNPCLCKS
jgi:hypothetical protein